MSIKKVQRLEEGPFDFVKGAGKEAGRKISNATAGIRRGANDIVQAGKDASAAGDTRKQQALVQELSKQMALLAQYVQAYDEMKGTPQDENPEGEQSTNDAEADNGQQPQQQQTDNVQQGSRTPGGVANAFRTQGKSKMTVNRGHGNEWSFESYLRLLHTPEDQLDEGAWDFIKGAGNAAVGKVKDQIQSYAQKPSMIKDLYNAGKQASQEGDVKSRALNQLKVVVGIIKKLGPAGLDAEQRAIISLPKNNQRRVTALLQRALNRAPAQVQSQSSA